jgi:DNA-directed RNA polymerase specialized sigma24 family protein
MADGPNGEAAPGPANFDDTFRRWYGPMVRTLSVASGDRDVAADCVQDAFERAYVRWGRVSRLEDPVGWVRHVAVNRMRDHFRRSERGRRRPRPRLTPHAGARRRPPAPRRCSGRPGVTEPRPRHVGPALKRAPSRADSGAMRSDDTQLDVTITARDSAATTSIDECAPTTFTPVSSTLSCRSGRSRRPLASERLSARF